MSAAPEGPEPAAPRAGDGSPQGLVVLDKPAGWTSHDVVARCRRLLGTRRVGHAGTLDPMATGVLVLGAGRGTRLLTHVVGADKDYEATVVLGASTVTDDAEGEVTATADPAALAALTRERLGVAVADLTGSIEQVPSAVSAVKVDGRRSYARVRAGEDVALAARAVTVSVLDVLAVRPGGARWEVDVAVTCSSGTYVRALARDLGAALGVGGHLSALRRTRVGGFGLDVARTLEEVAADPGAGLLPLAAAAALVLPVREVGEREAGELAHGRRITATGAGSGDGPGGGGSGDGGGGPADVVAVTSGGELVALVRDEGGSARPVVVFAPAP